MRSAKSGVRMKKVLLVEDNPTLQFLLTRQIESMGLTVITANNGKEGVEKAIEEKPHLILMNIMMPGIDGRQATRILAATVLFSELDLRSCIEAGCDNFIVKPFTVQELQRKIQELIPASSPKIQ